MKQLFLATACILFAAFSAQAQAPTMNFFNNTSYTVYVSGHLGTACTQTGGYVQVVPPGMTSITTGGSDYIHLRVYSYDPSLSGACSPNPINSINLSPCPGYSAPLTDMIDLYDTCPGPTPYTATVTWDNTNSPTSVDVTIN